MLLVNLVNLTLLSQKLKTVSPTFMQEFFLGQIYVYQKFHYMHADFLNLNVITILM